MKYKVCPRCRRQVPLPLWSGSDHVRIDETQPITMTRDGNKVSINATVESVSCFDFFGLVKRKE